MSYAFLYHLIRRHIWGRCLLIAVLIATLLPCLVLVRTSRAGSSPTPSVPLPATLVPALRLLPASARRKAHTLRSPNNRASIFVPSPDGRLVAYVEDPDHYPFDSLPLHLFNVSTGKDKLLHLKIAYPRPQGFSPDGKTLLVCGVLYGGPPHGKKGASDIFGTWKVPLANPASAVLISPNTVLAVGGAQFSPDGQYIAFAASDVLPTPSGHKDENTLGDYWIYIVRNDGSECRRLHRGGEPIAWSPDGRFLAFQQPDKTTNTEALFIMTSDGSQPASCLIATASYPGDSPRVGER